MPVRIPSFSCPTLCILRKSHYADCHNATRCSCARNSQPLTRSASARRDCFERGTASDSGGARKLRNRTCTF